jgi:hypothetical protein
MYIKERLQLSLYSLGNELPGPQTQQLGERVMGIGLWLWQGAEDRMVHGVSPLLIETLSGINQQDTPPPLSLRTPEMTITLGPKLSLRNYNAQVGEILAGVKVMNTLIGLGMPARQPVN